MKKAIALAYFALFGIAAICRAYVEAPYTLGQVIHESTHICVVEIVKINKEKNLIIYKKLKDIKGQHPGDQIKHNIGKNGFHPREWQNVMKWAEEGRKAVFFHNKGASETCTGTYWYQCYPQGDWSQMTTWWSMSHAEPFMLRTYCGDVDKLAAAVAAIVKGEEVVVPCMQDGKKDDLHLRKAKLQLFKASLKRLNPYNVKRDFVAFGGDGENVDIPEYKTTVLLPQTTGGWKFLPAKDVVARYGDKWREPGFDDASWRPGQTPIGYGQDEIKKRKGTWVKEEGVPFVFRKVVDIPQEVLQQKGVKLQMGVASDDSADVYVNDRLVDHDPVLDHDFEYWNREFEVPLKVIKPGRNVIAVYVRNHKGSHDIYLDMELTAQVQLPKKPKSSTAVTKAPETKENKPGAPKPQATEDKTPPKGLTVDKARKRVTVDCAIAPRKLPNLDRVYPLEVVACYPSPRGQKAHETVVVFDGCKPSHVHKALEQCGLKAGKPARGEQGKAEGPEVKVSLEFTGADGKTHTLPIEQVMVHIKTGKPMQPVRWLFTGSAMKQPDPEKDDTVYGADLTGTLITILPVTDDAVLQTHLTLKDEDQYKLEVAPNLLPKAGSPAKLIIEAK